MVSTAESPVFNPPKHITANAHCTSLEHYLKIHTSSMRQPENFWADIAKEFYFENECSGKFMDYNFNILKGRIYIKWMEGARTNICYNCLDRHVLAGRGANIAFHWAGNEPEDADSITYSEMLTEVCKVANYLKSRGVSKGDTVAIYMPMIKELVVAMLAVARLGAVHNIVFGGYSADSLAERVVDASAKVLICADGVWRGSKLVHLKDIVDDAMSLCAERGMPVTTCLVVKHMGRVTHPKQLHDAANEHPAKRTHFDDKNNYKVSWKSGVDVWWSDATASTTDECPVEWVDAEDPLFILYTSGSTGKPKGVLHTTAGYMLYVATTFKYTFDYHPGDVYFCTADIGWITGHSYVTYGPMLNGATSVIFEGVPTYPHAGRFWEIIEKYKVSKFYTAPTAIRALMKFGDEPVKKYDLSTLTVLGTVGEPINKEAWMWYKEVVGGNHVAIVDTFWQTETGGHVITPLPGATPAKPGSATYPFFGVSVALLNEAGQEIEGPTEGYLVFRRPWPGIMRTVYNDHNRFEETYFSRFPGYYCTGDGGRRDIDGYMWVTGRTDDMLNVSGHLLSTAQVESALVEVDQVAEAAAVARPHPVKGECLYCFITLNHGEQLTDELMTDMKNKVRSKIGPFAQPDYIQLAPSLPKTRSGKIMRRVLRKIAVGDRDFGDVSTLADPSVVEVLFENRPANA